MRHSPAMTGPAPDVEGVAAEETTWAVVDGRPLLATVYRPAATATASPAGHPMIVQVHGGAWTLFDRTVASGFDRALAAAGAVVVAIDFRQSGDAPAPAAMIDVNAAIRWTKSNAARLGGDPTRVGIWGASSGGHLALLAALCPTDPDYCAADGHETVAPWTPASGGPDATVQCVAAPWPITDVPWRWWYARARSHENPMFAMLAKAHRATFGDEATMRRHSPRHVVDEGRQSALPPMLVVQPRGDVQVTLPMQEDFAAAVTLAGGAIDLHVIDDDAETPYHLYVDRPDNPVAAVLVDFFARTL